MSQGERCEAPSREVCLRGSPRHALGVHRLREGHQGQPREDCSHHQHGAHQGLERMEVEPFHSLTFYMDAWETDHIRVTADPAELLPSAAVIAVIS